MDEKFCSKCQLTKPVTQFTRHKRSPDGLRLYCRACWKSYYRKKKYAEKQLELAAVDPRFQDFAALVQAGRQRLNLTQDAFGEQVGVTGSQVRLWEKSKVLPRGEQVRSICDLLGVVVPLSVTPGDNGRIPLGVLSCVVCGTPFPVYKANVKHCSRECSGKTVSEKQAGEANPSWSGGRTKVNGYTQVKVPDGYPGAYENGYILEHRYLMEQALGRTLEPHERVHHKNGDRSDNRVKPGHELGGCPPECCNLELWKVSTKDPPGVRARDYHCPGCRCFEVSPMPLA